MGLERDLELLRDLNTTASQLVMAVTNAIDETAYDLNADSFSATTNITNDYILDNVEFNFTTAASRNITITTTDGTQVYNATGNTDTHIVVRNFDMGFAGGDNLTVTVSQTGSACVMDCILKVRSGTNTLIGNPDVRIVDSSGNVYEDSIVSHCLPTINIDHFFTHSGATFTNSDTSTVTQSSFKDFLIITPSVSEIHLITFHFTSTQANAEVVLYEEPTTTDNGTSLTLVNKNRLSSNTSATSLYQDPTTTDVGTQLEHDLIVGGKQSGGSDTSESGEEWILKKDTKYLVRYNNNANQDDIVDWKITFLEPAQI